MAQRFDRHEATAQARIDRLEDRADDSVVVEDAPEDGRVPEDYGVAEDELADMHITDGDEKLPDGVEEHAVVEGDDLVDALAEAFNARDMDGVRELCCRDCEVPGLASGSSEVEAALSDLWERRPTVTLTRAVDDGRAFGVLWERIASGSWGAIGTVHPDLDGERAAVLEFSDDVGLLDRVAPPAPDDEDPLWEDLEALDDNL
jgi:hypothetical protein